MIALFPSSYCDAINDRSNYTADLDVYTLRDEEVRTAGDKVMLE